jgi:hypothetical protein
MNQTLFDDIEMSMVGGKVQDRIITFIFIHLHHLDENSLSEVGRVLACLGLVQDVPAQVDIPFLARAPIIY